MGNKTGTLLESRRKRLGLDGSSSNDTRGSLLERRKERLASDGNSIRSDIYNRYKSALESHNAFVSENKSKWGDDARDAYNSHREDSIAVSKLKRDVEAYRSILGEDADKIVEALDDMGSGYGGFYSRYQFKDEGEYNAKFVYPQKYQGKSHEEIQAEYEAASKDKNRESEANWLKSYSENYGYTDDGYYSAYTKSVDDRLAEIESKIEEAKAFGTEYDGTYDYGFVPNANTHQKYTKQDEIDSLEAERTALTAEKKRVQYNREGFELGSVSNSDPDFQKYADIGAKVDNPDSIDDKMGWFAVGGWQPFGEEVNNPVTFALNNKDEYDKKSLEAVAGGGQPNPKAYGINHLVYEMNEDEIAVYNYYIGKGDKESADKYLDSITGTLNNRLAQKIFKPMEGNTAGEIVFGAVVGLDQFSSGVNNFFSDEEDYIPASAIAQAGQMVREDLDDDGFDIMGNSLGQLAYDMVTTTANMAPSIAMGAIPVVGQGLGITSMGVSAAGNAYSEAINSGYSKGQARAYSTLVGASEAGLSYLLGGISKLGGKVSGNIISKLTSGVNNAFARAAITIGGNMVSEFTEEGLQEVLDPFFKNIAMNADNDWSDVEWGQVAYSGLLGALSAGILEGGDTIAGEVNTYKQGKDVIEKGETSNLVKFGKSLSADTVAYKLADKIDKGEVKTGAYTIGRLLHEAGADSLSETNIAEIEKSLVRKGVAPSHATTIATWLNKAVEGGHFTKSQRNALESNEVVSQTFKDIILNQNSTVNQRMFGAVENGYLTREQLEKLADNGTNAGALASAALKSDATAEASVEEADAPKAPKAVDTTGFALLSDAEVKKRIADDPLFTIAYEQFMHTAGLTAKDGKIDTTDYSVSEDNKTYLNVNGEAVEVEITGVNSIKKGEVYVNLSNGKTVSVKELDLGSEDDAIIFEGIAGMDIDAGSAQLIYKAFTNTKKLNEHNEKSTDAMTYIKGAMDAVKYGRIGGKAYLDDGVFTSMLSEVDRKDFYRIGEITAENQARESAATVKKAIRSNKGKSVVRGSVTFDGVDPDKLNARQKVSVNALSVAFGSMGVHVEFFESPVNERGIHTGENGSYNPETNTIRLDIAAGVQGKDTILFTAAHELTHFIKEWSPAKFKVFADLLVAKYAAHGIDVEALVQRKIEASKHSKTYEKPLTHDEAFEEVVADSCETFLRDSHLMDTLIDLAKKDLTLFERCKLFIENLLADLKKSYNGLAPDSLEAKYVLDMKDCIEDLHKMWEDAALSARDNFQAAGGKKAQKNTTSKDGVKHSASREDAIRSDEKLRQQLTDWLNGNGKKNGTYNGRYFDIGETPEIFVKHGAPDASIIMFPNCVEKITGFKGDDGHTFSLEEIAKLPSQLNDPILLFKGSVPNSFIALTEIVDKQGHDAVVAVHIKRTYSRSVINKIASVYSKTNEYGRNKIVSYVTNQINAGNLIDASNKKASNWFTTQGLQLPKVVQTILDANNIIREDTQKSQGKKSERALLPEKIKIDMTDAERYEILKNRKITLSTPNKAGFDTAILENPELLDKKLKENDAKKLLKKIGTEFGVFGHYNNSDMDVEFEFGKNNLDESLHKQKGNYDVYAQMLSCFSDVITNAVGIEIHNRNNDGYKVDRTLKNVYVLCSAFETDADIIPVKLEIKEFYDKPNRLYVAVALEGIKKDRVESMGVPTNRSHVHTSPVNISISDLFAKINPLDIDFLKYIPKEFLDSEQIDALNKRSNNKKSDRNPYVGEIYSYNALISKPDMRITSVNDQVKYESTSTVRKNIVNHAIKNAESVGKINKNENVVIHVDDIDTDVVLSRKSLIHGLDRRLESSTPVILNIGRILKNAIRINEFIPKKQSAFGSYVLIGYAESQNYAYPVRMVVNQYTNEVDKIDVLYAVNTKKETVGKMPGSHGKTALPTVSKISISKLLDYVNKFFPDVLSESVLQHYGRFERPDGELGRNALFSDRDPYAVEYLSPRNLLANALESTIDTTMQAGQNELRKLKEYKAKIQKIEEFSKELSEVNAKIREKSFTKGKDRSGLAELQARKIFLEDQINRADKKLFQLEQTKPLKDVLERERKKGEKKVQKKYDELLQEEKKRSDEKLKEVSKKYQESRKKGIENRHRTQMRHKIKDIVADLNKVLLNPTKEKHIPIGLQKAVAEALDVINMDTINADARVAEYNDRIAKSSNPDEIAKLVKSRDHILYQGENLKERFSAFKAAYAEIKNSDDPMVRNSHDETIEALIESTVEKVGNTSLRDMTLEQLEAVYDMFKAVRKTVQSANKLFKENRQATISESRESVKTEVREVGGQKARALKITKFARKYGWNSLKPIYAMRMIGSDTLTDLYNNVRKGEDTWAVDVSEARKVFLDNASTYGYWNWDLDKQFEFYDMTGQKFSLSVNQIMSLYAYSKRKQADKHLEFGGFIFGDTVEVTEKKHGIPFKYEVNDANPYRLRKDIVDLISTALTNEQRAFVDAMQKYLSEDMGEKGNEVSLAMYDIKLFKEKNYFPLKTSRYFREFDPEKSGTPKIKNSGFSKNTVPQAGNPIVLDNFMDVWANHVNEMSMYHAFVLPLEDFMRVYNYSTVAGGYDSVQQCIKNAYGDAACKYIETLMNDLNGGARVDSTADIMTKGISLFKKAAVFSSASVVIQQPSAIARAAAVIDNKYFVTKLSMTQHKSEWEEVKKYAPVAIIKEMGYFDVNMGRSTVDFITAKEYNRFGEKAKAVVTDSSYRDEVLSKAPALADELSWCYIWNAVKKEIADTTDLKKGSEEFLKKAGERFTEVITLTQVYDSVLSRSAMMRSKDTGMKMAMAFMAEPTTSMNMLVDAIVQGKRGNKKAAAKAVGAVVSSLILNSILVSFVYAGRDDDEEKTYVEKYFGTLSKELIDSLNPLTMMPFIKDIISIFQGYDVSRTDMSIVADLYDAWNSLSNEKKSTYRKVEDFGGAIAKFLGLPLKNIMRDVRGLYNTVNSFLGGNTTSAKGIYEAVKESVTGEELSNGEAFYEAMVYGDQSWIDRVKSRITDEEKAATALKTAIGKHFREGDIDADTAGEYLEEYLGMEDDDIHWQMDRWQYAAETRSSEGYAKYGDFFTAVESGKNLRAVIQEYTNNGVEKSRLAARITDYFKPIYKEMSNYERASLKGHLLNAYSVLGYERSKKSKDIDKWLKE